ncbi:hypothetical protein Tco_0751176 [Tanacetum coccineum]|uniref:Uncharacterized protein n=1 Tax=Tanacetum coccineum TaxID=301880 RepID=A0ABQ4Z4A3_9ASTR
MHNLFRGGNVTSGTSALQSVEGRSKGGDDVGNGIGKSGGVPDGGVSDRGGGSDSGWGVDGNGGDTDSGGDGIYGSGDEYDVSGDGGGVDMERSLSTSASDGNGIGV